MEILDRDIYHIASDYFSGRISTSDQEYLNGWLSQSDENKDLFAGLEKVWKLTGSLQTDIKPDIDAEWTRFVQNREQTNRFAEPIKLFKTIWANPVLRVAAITIPVFFIVAALIFIFSIKSDNIEWVTINAGDTKIEQILPDGSEVWININSSLSYQKEFASDKRIVRLSGEGFFNVVKHKGTFLVDAGASEIKVLGTQFNVKINAKEETTEVFVKEGKVSFASSKDKNKNVTLIAGEKGVLNSNEIRKETTTDANSFAWMTQKLTFNNTSVDQIGNDVSKYFNKTVIVHPSLQNISFTGNFTNPELEEVLRTMCLSIKCSYQVKKDTVFIGISKY
jgi:transmembrane sensor